MRASMSDEKVQRHLQSIEDFIAVNKKFPGTHDLIGSVANTRGAVSSVLSLLYRLRQIKRRPLPAEKQRGGRKTFEIAPIGYPTEGDGWNDIRTLKPEKKQRKHSPKPRHRRKRVERTERPDDASTFFAWVDDGMNEFEFKSQEALIEYADSVKKILSMAKSKIAR